MKRAILYGTFIALLCLLTGVAGAQTRQAGAYSVSGVLIDSLSHESEPYATIRIYLKTSPQEPVKLAVTDLDGKFDVPLTKADDYILYITSVGKRTVQRAFTLSGQNKRADLGTLYTSEDSEMLAGVEVVAQKPLVKAEIDKIAYSIEDDPDAKTNTTLEMLRKVPLVTVDAEDNIQVNGSSNFKVHVNGKPNTLMSNNPKEVLRSLPANSIKSIEVITEPGAKYDAEGIGGILNIITTDAKMQGYNVTLGANAGNRNAGAYAYGTVQVGKFTATGNYSYQTQYAPRGYTSSGREDYTSERYKYLSSDGSSKSDGTFQFGNIEASYEIDTLNLLTFSTNIFGGNFSSDNQSGTEMLDANRSLAYRYNTRSENSNTFGNVGVNLDYQHSMKRKGEYLTASYKFNNSPNNSEAETYYEDAEAVPFDLIDQRYDNDAHTTEHTLQLDYVNPLNETHYIDAGAKYIFRKNASDSRYFLEQPDGSLEGGRALRAHLHERGICAPTGAEFRRRVRQRGPYGEPLVYVRNNLIATSQLQYAHQPPGHLVPEPVPGRERPDLRQLRKPEPRHGEVAQPGADVQQLHGEIQRERHAQLYVHQQRHRALLVHEQRRDGKHLRQRQQDQTNPPVALGELEPGQHDAYLHQRQRLVRRL